MNCHVWWILLAFSSMRALISFSLSSTQKSVSMTLEGAWLFLGSWWTWPTISKLRLPSALTDRSIWRREHVHVGLICLGNQAKNLKAQQMAYTAPAKYEKWAIQLHLQNNTYNLIQMNNNNKTLLFQRQISHMNLSTSSGWELWYFLTEHFYGLLIRETIAYNNNMKIGRSVVWTDNHSESHVYFFNGINLLHQKAVKVNTMEQNQIQCPLFIHKILKGDGKIWSNSPGGLFSERPRSQMLQSLLVWFTPAQNEWPCSRPDLIEMRGCKWFEWRLSCIKLYNCSIHRGRAKVVPVLVTKTF